MHGFIPPPNALALERGITLGVISKHQCLTENEIHFIKGKMDLTPPPIEIGFIYCHTSMF